MGATYPMKISEYMLFGDDGYTHVDFLNDIDHVISHKLRHPQLCKAGSSCIHLQRACRDRSSEQCKTLNAKKQFFNCNDQSDFVYISMLDRAHVLLMHSDDVSDKMTKNIKKLKDDSKAIQYFAYNTGVYIKYHTLKPLYQNLFDEVVRNDDCEVTDEQFNSELIAAKLFSKTKHVINEWRAWKTDKRYGIKVNEPMHIEHILCAKFYCNYSKLCEQFRRSYRGSVDSTDDDIMRKHCNNHYWFGRFLTTAIEFWGERPTKSDNFYHGL